MEENLMFNSADFSDRVLRLEILPARPSEFGVTDSKFKKIHINSLMLAYKSQFFYKLFKNDIKETQQMDEVVLKINESEEVGFMDLLKFIYDQSVDATSAAELVDVLMAADKFEVPSCVNHCVELLLKLPMSIESAVLYLGLPSSVLANEAIQKTIEASTSYLCAHYSDFTTSQEEAIRLPLYAVEILMAFNGLQVKSEDDVFDFLLKWVRHHYSLKERQEILTKLVVNFIYLPNMSSLKLKQVIDCSDLDSEKVYKPVLDALFCKDQDVATVTPRYEYPKRMYMHRVIVKVVQLQLDRPRCLVYFDLTKKECAALVPMEKIYSQTFYFHGHKMALYAMRKKQGPFLIYVHLLEDSESCTMTLGISAMTKSSGQFTSLGIAENISFQTTKALAVAHPFKNWWEEFMSDESEYFINGILHTIVDITIIA